MAAAGPVTKTETEKLLTCYFPWLCGLHILLDYFIDLDEDLQHGDLNFVSFYPGTKSKEDGLTRFLDESLVRVETLPRPVFHRTVTQGLLALYLSDPKALSADRNKISQQLLRQGGPEGLWLQKVCTLLRSKGLI
jgi:tetraprenyl-beta-curcumene synthase